MADPVTSNTDLLGSLAGLMGTNTAKGAALGALMSKLLSSIEAPGGVNQGVDMSKVGNIPSRQTTIPVPNYVPYAEYGARDIQPTITPELAKALGIPMGMPTQTPLSQYTSRPQMVTSGLPTTITSVGTGKNTQPNPTVTARGSNTIDPMTGALLGASLGYIMPESQAYTASGATQSGINALQNFGKSGVDAFGGLLKYVPGLSSAGKAISDWANSTNYNYLNNYNSTYSQPADPDTGIYNYPVYKDGGMAAPLMADGGEVQTPSYYTFGQVVNPADILNQMAQGGQPKQGGLHVPTVEGRHDYRAGSRVTGEGDGQSDDIPAMLADGEYVFDADTVAQLGNGSTKAGSDLLDKFREEIRAHKRSAPINKIPPPAKSPLAYMKAAQSRSKKNG